MRSAKQVFTKNEIAHVWIHNGYSRKGVNGNSEWVPAMSGRTAKYKSSYDGYEQRGNQHFERDKFYSYTTQIAQRYNLGDKILYIVDDYNYSRITNDQVRHLWHAIPNITGYDDKATGKHYDVERVNIDCYGQFPFRLDVREIRRCFTLRTVAQVKYLISKTRTQRERRKYTVVTAQGKLTYLKHIYDAVNIPYCDDVVAIQEELDKVPEYIAKERVHNPNQRRYIRNLEEALQYLPNLPMLLWKKSLQSKLYGGHKDESKFIYPLDDLIGEKKTISLTMKDVGRTWDTIRVIGNQVVTSQGIRMPLMDAYFLYQGMVQVLGLPLGESINVGGYSIMIDKFKHYGLPLRQHSIFIGCHNFHLTTIISQYQYLLSHLKEQQIDVSSLPPQ